MNQTWSLGHRPALDGLRGIAILLVIAGHMTIPGLDSGGWAGVTLFFVLSGFLITTLLLEERSRTGSVDLARFYMRRARRLLPAVVVFLAVTAPVLVYSGALDVGAEVAAIMTYVANWYTAVSGDTSSEYVHLWSLSVEEQFYIVWPALLLGLIAVTHARPRLLLSVVLAGAAASAILRVIVFDGSAGSLQRVYVGTDTRADALLIGAAVAIAFHHGWVWRPAWPVVAAAGGVVLLVSAPTGAGQDAFASAELLVGLPAVALASAVLVAKAATTGHRALELTPLRATGKISYSLYLWQGPMLAFGWMFGLGWLGASAVGVGLAFFAAIVSYRYVEAPFRHARLTPDLGRLSPSPTPS